MAPAALGGRRRLLTDGQSFTMAMIAAITTQITIATCMKIQKRGSSTRRPRG